ncbi:MAG: acyltransferase [Deltaproteobacteria bacterium]|nr:acyltransferase [Deltaproteobacteria bacterium]
MGDGCWIGPGCFINSYGGVRLGRRVGLGPGACVLSSEHAGGERDRAVLDTPLEAREVVIEDGADLGARSVILPGVRIGARARVGAGAVVTRSVPAGAVVAGVPARPLHSEEPR